MSYTSFSWCSAVVEFTSLFYVVLTIKVIMSESSESKSLLPEWLTNAFLEGYLRDYYKNDSIQIIDFDVKSDVGKGEGYMSSMLRTKINFCIPGNNGQNVSFPFDIMKVIHHFEIFCSKLLNVLNIFRQSM